MATTKLNWWCPTCPAHGEVVQDSDAPAMSSLAAIIQEHLRQSPTCPTPRKIRMETEQEPDASTQRTIESDLMEDR